MIKSLIMKLLPKGKATLKLELKVMEKLQKKIDSDLVHMYGGLHPKHMFYTRHEWVAQFIDKDDIVVDIASGSGCCSYNLAAKCRKVIAMDLQKSEARFLVPENIQFHHGDILKILTALIDDYTFAVAFHILEHLDDPVGFLKQVRADRIAVIVPHEENWFIAVKKELGLNWKGDRTHRRLYDHGLLRQHLTEGGYGDIKFMEFDGDNGLRALAYRERSAGER